MQLEKISVSSEPLYEMMFASIQTKLLLAAIKLKIFDRLGQAARSGDEIAAELDGNPLNTA